MAGRFPAVPSGSGCGRGQAPRQRAAGRPRIVVAAARIGSIRSGCSRARRPRACRISCRSAMAGCRSRRSRSIAARRCRWPRTSRRDRGRASPSSSAATRTCRTSACSPRLNATSSSTSTTSTRRSLGRSSSTSSGSRRAWSWPAASSASPATTPGTWSTARCARIASAWPATRPCAAIDVFYARVDATGILAYADKGARAMLEGTVKSTAHHDAVHDLPKLTALVDGKRRIVEHPPTLIKLPELTPMLADSRLRAYRETLQEDLRVLLDRYRLADFALKVVGVGSVGLGAFVVLLIGADGRRPAVPAGQAGGGVRLRAVPAPSAHASHGERVVTGQRRLQAASDILLGWAVGERGQHAYFRQLQDQKGSAVIDTMTARGPRDVGRAVCLGAGPRPRALGRPAVIAGYLGTDDAFDHAMATSPRHTPTRTSGTMPRCWRRSRAVGSRPSGRSDRSSGRIRNDPDRRRPRPPTVAPEDAPAVLAVCQDPEIARWVTIPQPFGGRCGRLHRERADDVARWHRRAVRHRRRRHGSAARRGDSLRPGGSPGHLRPLARA